MTYSTYLKWGTGLGFVGGVITSEHYAAKASNVNTELLQVQKDNLIPYIVQAIFPSTIPKSTLCLLTGPFVGASAGTGLYNLKNIRFIPHPVQAVTWLTAVTAITAFSFYHINND